ncbi:hypothetical protein LTR53_017733, partial [Teratosphaeriaceae sp. CCFEE 6253]
GPQQKGGIRQVMEESDANRPGSSSMAKIYQLKKNPGSTPELSLLGSAEKVDSMPAEGESTVSFPNVTWAQVDDRHDTRRCEVPTTSLGSASLIKRALHRES